MTPADKDQMHRKFIAASLYLQVMNPKHQQFLLYSATPEERAVHMKTYSRRLLAGMVLVVVLVAIVSLFPHRVGTVEPAHETIPAGHVVSVDLHVSSFSTATSVVTSAGTFQVYGGVTAAVGDKAVLKKARSAGASSELCIESQLKSACYPLQ